MRTFKMTVGGWNMMESSPVRTPRGTRAPNSPYCLDIFGRCFRGLRTTGTSKASSESSRCPYRVVCTSGTVHITNLNVTSVTSHDFSGSFPNVFPRFRQIPVVLCYPMVSLLVKHIKHDQTWKRLEDIGKYWKIHPFRSMSFHVFFRYG